MKKIILLISLVLTLNLFSIEYRTATGADRSFNSRDSLIYFHNNQDDQHWFGSDSWAVKFDFNNYFNLIDSLNFQAEGALVYIPFATGNDPIELKLTLDDADQPGSEPQDILFNETRQPDQGWNIFDFNQSFIDTTFWLVVDYPTNSTDQFISASAIDGSHSYFESDGYYYNMLANSFASEFMFSLMGNFVTDGLDLDLADLEWMGTIAPEEVISPRFTIINNSDQICENAYIELTLENPQSEIALQYLASGTTCDSILIPQIAANDVLVLDVSDSLGFSLPRDPAQYNWEATIFCLSDSLTQNNELEGSFAIFNANRNLFLLENAVKLGDAGSQNILQYQHNNYSVENVQLLNFYFEPSDLPYFCQGAYQRFSYYDLFSYPTTLIDGSSRILGYNSSYGSQLDSLYLTAAQKNSFVNSSNFSGSKDQDGNVNVYIELTNVNTSLFNDMISDLRMLYVVSEKLVDQTGLPASIEVTVLRGIVGESSSPQINAEETFSDTIGFNYLDDIEIITQTANCEIIAILQHDETRDIFFVDKLSFDDLSLTSVEDEPEIGAITDLQIAPNPVIQNTNISFSIKENYQEAELEIFNIKGQIIKRITRTEITAGRNFFTWDGKDESLNNVGSGIYLMRLTLKNADRETFLYRKCLKLNK